MKGKRVLVLSSSSGIGYAVAKAYSDEGAILAMSSSNRERIQIAANSLSNAKGYVADFTQKGAAKALLQEVIRDLGGLDILVTNTGDPKAGNFFSLDTGDWEEGFRLTFLSAVEAIKEAANYMKAQNFGRIILNLSISAKEPFQNLALSTSLRPGLLGVMKLVSNEVALHNVTVNAILPGYTDTPRLKKLGSTEEMGKHVPMGRVGSVEEFASLALFLGSEQAGYITGQSIACDGGYLKGF